MVDINLENLKSELEGVLGFELDSHIDQSSDPITFEFESEEFELSFWIEDEETFVIGNIEVFTKGENIGESIIQTLIDFCESEGFNQIKAHKVKSDAFGFWEKQNFDCDHNNCYYDL